MNSISKELGIELLAQKIDALSAKVDALSIDRRPEWYTLQQVADEWGKSPRTIGRYVANGELPVVRRGKTPMVHRDVISQGDPRFQKP